VLRWLKTVVVSDQGKGSALIGSGGDQEDVPEALSRDGCGVACVVEASKNPEMASKPGICCVLGMSLAAARVAGRVVSGVEAA
jgi:hypothetical protein